MNREIKITKDPQTNEYTLLYKGEKGYEMIVTGSSFLELSGKARTSGYAAIWSLTYFRLKEGNPLTQEEFVLCLKNLADDTDVKVLARSYYTDYINDLVPILYKDEVGEIGGGYEAYYKEIPVCGAYGDTEEKAIELLKELALDYLIESGDTT